MPDRAAMAVVLALGTALVGTGAYVVLGRDGEDPDLAYRVVSVEPQGPERIRVTFEVDKAPDTEARCQVAAFTESGSSAGRLNDVLVRARPDGARSTTTTVVVPTKEEAADAAVAQCVVRRVGG